MATSLWKEDIWQTVQVTTMWKFAMNNDLFDKSLQGDEKAVRILLDQGADPDSRGQKGFTPLQMAAFYGYSRIACALLAHGASVNKTDTDHESTPLIHAAMQGSSDVASILLAKGAAVDHPDKTGFTALHYAAGKGHETVVDILLAKGVKPAPVDSLGQTPLHLAVDGGFCSITRALLAHVTEIDIVNQSGDSPLHKASALGHDAIVRMLAQRSSRIGLTDFRGNTALHLAVVHNHHGCVQHLLAAGADPDARNNEEYTALQIATSFGYLQTVKTLLFNGANPNSPSPSCGSTALHYAACNDNIAIINALLAGGADPAVQSVKGVTPNAIATFKGHKVIAHILTHHKADHQPMSLQKSCRMAIRSRLIANQPQQSLTESINKLGYLPKDVKVYLYSHITL